MDIKRLSKLQFLITEAEMLKSELAYLNAKREGVAFVLTGLPTTNKSYDHTGSLALKIVALEDAISLNLSKIIEERKNLECFINDIEDSETRLIFRLRHIYGLHWGDVARYMGYDGIYSESTVRKRYKRCCDSLGVR